MKMKETLIATGGICGLICLLGLGGCIENTYTIDGKVTKVEDNIVIIKDKGSYTWEFVDNENQYTENDNVVLTMDTNTTDSTRKDDYVISVKKG